MVYPSCGELVSGIAHCTSNCVPKTLALELLTMIGSNVGCAGWLLSVRVIGTLLVYNGPTDDCAVVFPSINSQ